MSESERQTEIISRLETLTNDTQQRESSSVAMANAREKELRLLQKANHEVVESLKAEVEDLKQRMQESSAVHA